MTASTNTLTNTLFDNEYFIATMEALGTNTINETLLKLHDIDMCLSDCTYDCDDTHAMYWSNYEKLHDLWLAGNRDALYRFTYKLHVHDICYLIDGGYEEIPF